MSRTYQAVVALERPDHTRHRIASYNKSTPLQALRAAHEHVEARWLNIAPLIEEGERLQIKVS